MPDWAKKSYLESQEVPQSLDLPFLPLLQVTHQVQEPTITAMFSQANWGTLGFKIENMKD